MQGVVDQEARERITALETVLWGPSKNNGLRSQVEGHETRLDSIEDWRAHYLDAERKRTCYGLAEIESRDQEAVEQIEEDTDVKVAEINAGGQVAAAKETARGQVAREWVVVAGTVLLLLKDYIAPLLQQAAHK